ncbi:MAG: hypothetical protein GY936_20495, partial [Ignavibacteriae bacterium]|nr:hypothetical protein [Ignavibacteriota bacterium]
MNSIKLKVFLPMLLLTLFIVSGVFYTISFLNVQESSGAIINIAGRQRM